MTGDRFQPRALLTVFDVGLRRAIYAIRGSGIHWCDSFHIVQNCLRWLSLKGAPVAVQGLVLAGLRRLIVEKDYAEFEAQKARFLELIAITPLIQVLCK